MWDGGQNEQRERTKKSGGGGCGVGKKDEAEEERWGGKEKKRRGSRAVRAARGGGGRKRDIFTAPIYKMGYDQLNSAILRGTRGGMRYIGSTRRTRKTDAHRTLKYVLIILACLPAATSSSASHTHRTCLELLSHPCSLCGEDRASVLSFRGPPFARQLYMQERDKRMQFRRPGRRCCDLRVPPSTPARPSRALVSRNVRCQEPRSCY